MRRSSSRRNRERGRTAGKRADCRQENPARSEGCGRRIYHQRVFVRAAGGVERSYTDFDSEMGKSMIKTSIMPKLFVLVAAFIVESSSSPRSTSPRTSSFAPTWTWRATSPSTCFCTFPPFSSLESMRSALQPSSRTLPSLRWT